MRILVVGTEATVEAISSLFVAKPAIKVEHLPIDPVVIPPGEKPVIALVLVESIADPLIESIPLLKEKGLYVAGVARDESIGLRERVLAAGASDVLFGSLTAERIEDAAASIEGRRLRREVRYATPIRWSFRRPDGSSLEGTLINLSTGGFKVKSPAPIPVGELGMVKLETPDNFKLPSIYARVLASGDAEKTPSGGRDVWVRARFVGLVREERDRLASYLQTLEREESDPVASLVEVAALQPESLLTEGASIGGMRVPPLTSLERKWLSAEPGDPRHALQAIPVARLRGTMIANLLSAADKLPDFPLPFERWREENAGARALLAQASTKALVDAEGTSDAKLAWTEIEDRLRGASDSLDRLEKKFVDSQRRTIDAAAIPEEPPDLTPSKIAARGAPRVFVQKEPAAPRAPIAIPRGALIALGVVGMIVAVFLGLFLSGAFSPAVERKSGEVLAGPILPGNPVIVRTVVAGGSSPLAVVAGWDAADGAAREAAAKALAAKLKVAILTLRDEKGRKLAVVTDGKTVAIEPDPTPVVTATPTQMQTQTQTPTAAPTATPKKKKKKTH